MRTQVCIAITLALCAAACDDSNAPQKEPIRPVRAVIIHSQRVPESFVLTGYIKPEEEITLAFRLDGKLIDRKSDVGNYVLANQVVARIDPQIQMNQARAAEADLSAAQAALATADRNEKRERDNFNKGNTPRQQYDQFAQQLQSAQAQVEATQARLNSANEQVKYTELRANVDGLIIAKGAEQGEIVRAGQPIFKIARGGIKNALFDVPPRFLGLQGATQDVPIDLSLSDNPNVRVVGYVKEVGLQVDPVTRAVSVKVSLPGATDEMRFGAPVKGTLTMVTPDQVEIPSSALLEFRGDPSVWVIYPTSMQVSLRTVQISRYNPGSVVIKAGLQDGEMVVTAGVQSLRPGQQVKLLDSPQ